MADEMKLIGMKTEIIVIDRSQLHKNWNKNDRVSIQQTMFLPIYMVQIKCDDRSHKIRV
jgi:hypothetical protein